MSRDEYRRILNERFRLENAIQADVNIHGAGVDLNTLRADFTYDVDGHTYEVTIRELEEVPA